MPLDVGLQPILGNIEAFHKMVSFQPVDLGVVLPAVTIINMGPKPSHDYQRRLSSLRNLAQALGR